MTAGVIAVGACMRLLDVVARRSRRVAIVCAALVAVAFAFAVQHALVVADDVDLRFVWVLLAYVVALVLVLPVVARRSASVPVLGGLALLVAASFWILASQASARIVIARYSPTVGTAARVVARIVDVDADGHSFVGGEGDCAPFDGAIHPFAVDVPGDGVDQDCHGGDLAEVPVGPGTIADAPAVRDRPNVLLVTIETLRADHVGLYGYARDTTPSLDARFADDAVLFERAYTVAPVTDRTLPAILTAVVPSRLTESLDYETHVLAGSRVLLPERLHDAGYHTVVLQSFHLFDDHGLDQGIDDLVILHDVKSMGAKATTKLALAKLRAHVRDHPRAPLFLWIHYYEPHARHTPPAEHRLWDQGREYDEENPVDLYDGEIHHVDAQIGALFRGAEELGLLDGAYVIVASDHGEEFLEHGRRMHAYAVYEESIRVPLMFSGPGLAARRIAEPVSLIDLTPTLLDLLDIPFVDGVDGVSRADVLRGGAASADPILVEQYKHGSDELQKIALVEGTDKLILDLENTLWEMYDLQADPSERSNVYGRDPARTLAMRDRILDHLAMTRAVRLPAPAQAP
jgi:arylsulfatase A-like enzyme